MLSLQSFLREGRVVGLCWAQLKPKGPEGSMMKWTGPKGGPLKNKGQRQMGLCLGPCCLESRTVFLENYFSSLGPPLSRNEFQGERGGREENSTNRCVRKCVTSPEAGPSIQRPVRKVVEITYDFWGGVEFDPKHVLGRSQGPTVGAYEPTRHIRDRASHLEAGPGTGPGTACRGASLTRNSPPPRS